MFARIGFGAGATHAQRRARVVWLLSGLAFTLCVCGARAAGSGQNSDAPQSSYAISAGTDAQSDQDFSFNVDQALASRNHFLLSGGRTRVPLVAGYQNGYNGSLGMTTNPDKLYSYGASVNMAYLGENLKSQSLTGAWSYSGDTWMFMAKPTLRTIAIYIPGTPPTDTDVLGAGGSIAATRYFNDSWSATAGGEYYKYWGDTTALPVLFQALHNAKIPLAFISNYLRERWWLESEYDFDTVSVLAGLDDSHSLLSRDWVSTTYLDTDFDLSDSFTLNTELGATGFSTANWYVTLGLTWYR